LLQPEATSVDKGIIPEGHEDFDPDDPKNNELPHPTNVDRANWAYNALATFGVETFGRLAEEDAHTVISDFLCDLRHLCRMNGLDFDSLLARADGHYVEEVRNGGW
jgi:hypothetical protein